MSVATATVSRVGQLLLVRLLTAGKKGPGPKRLREEVGRFLPQRMTDEQWQTLVEELTQAGLITSKPLALTDVGRAEALAILGVESLPPRATWSTVRQRYLVP